MREADLQAVLDEYEQAGFRVRFAFDNEVDYIPDRGEPGKPTREEAEHLAAQVRRVAKFRGWSDVVVVGQDLEPLHELDSVEAHNALKADAVKTPGPQPDFVPSTQAEILAQLGALLNEMAAPKTSPAPQPPARPQAAESDWDRKQRERNEGMDPRAARFIQQSGGRIDASILVNPEALVEGLTDTSD